MTNIGDQLNKYDLDSVPKQSPISTLEKVEKNIVKTKDFTETMKFMSLVNSPKLCLMYLADNSCSEDVTEIEIDKLLDFTKYHHAYLNFNSSSDITKLSLSFNSHLGNSKNDISEQ